ncbi:MAG: hypothetical protein H6510_13925 [Acidobacteria bacterium]|nr:hypothetical protein [Acidobacteriota bacterium]MCB9398906.1 hypothetical protein [Acidobacteriota bacterium]
MFCFVVSLLMSSFPCEIESYLHAWDRAVETDNSSEIEQTYHDTAMLYFDKTVVSNRHEIAQFWVAKDLKNLKSSSLKILPKGPNRFMDFGKISSSSAQFVTVTGWYLEMGAWKRELHVILSKQPGSPAFSEVDLARRQWVKLANENRVDRLVAQLYTADCAYLSYGDVFSGHSGLIEAYQYMGGADYHVDLSFCAGSALGVDRVLEVGYYMANGDMGPYLLVWRKEEIWKIELDANY